MFSRILFPTDFSVDSSNALRRAVHLTKFREGEIIVQHVVNNFFGPHSHWASLFDVHELQKQMDFHVDTDVMGLLSDHTKHDVTVRRMIVQGKPPEQISRLAQEEMVDLIVMGKPGGAITMKVVRSVARPVLSVPTNNLSPNEMTKPFERILVATDFLHQSKKVTDYALEIKKMLNCPLYLIYAVKAPSALAQMLRQEEVASALDKTREWAERQMRNTIPEGLRSDGSVHVLAKLGRTSDCILEAADEIDASVIIMGAKGYDRMEHFYGTTVERVLTKAKRPVLTLQVVTWTW